MYYSQLFILLGNDNQHMAYVYNLGEGNYDKLRVQLCFSQRVATNRNLLLAIIKYALNLNSFKKSQ